VTDVEVIEGLSGELVGFFPAVLVAVLLLFGDRVSSFDGHRVFGYEVAVSVQTIQFLGHEGLQCLVLVFVSS